MAAIRTQEEIDAAKAAGASVGGSAGSGVLSGNSASGSADQSQAVGTNWTNLNKYIDANAGQGGRMANDITADTTKTIQSLNGPGGKVDSWGTAAHKETDDATKQDPYSNTISNGTTEDIHGINKDDFNVWKLKPAYALNGPTNAAGASGYTPLFNEVDKTDKKITSLGTQAGQQTALKDTYGANGQGYSSGFGSLDGFLLRGDKQGQDNIANFQKDNANFKNPYNTAVTGVGDYIKGAPERGAANEKKVYNAMTGRYEVEGNTAAINGRRFDDAGAQFDSTFNAIGKAYTDKGLKAPVDINGYVKPKTVSNNPYLNPTELDVINFLAGGDNNEATTTVKAEGDKNAYDVDWDLINKDIANLTKPKPPNKVTPSGGGGSGSISRPKQQQ